MNLSSTMRYLRNCIATMVLLLLSLVALTGQAFATNGEHTFANPGGVSGGFKPVGNHFLVSALFEPDLAPNDTAICYNTTGLSAPAPKTVTGMIIKADGTNLTSFNLTDMKFTIYPLSGGPENISSLKITATLSVGGPVSLTVNPGSRAEGSSFKLSDFPAAVTALSSFTNVTQLSIDITTANDVWLIDFSTITTANEVYPSTVAPTIQATNAQAVVVGSTELNIGWTSGNGSSRVVFAKNGVTTGAPTLADSTTYAANGNFSLATDPDSDGWKCVYNGNSNFATITGLSATTQYRFVVFEYNGASGREGYLITGAGNSFNQTTGGSLGVWTRGDIAGLDGTNNFWTRTDAERDANGNIYVGHRYNYYNNTNAQYQVEKWDGASWSTLTTFTALSAGYSGFSDYASTAVTGVNQVRMVVSGSQAATGVLTEAKYNGAWSFSDIDSTSIVNTSLNQPVIAVDGTGASHVLYEFLDSNTGSRNQYIKLASWNGSAWNRQTLSTVPNPDSSNGVKTDYLLLNDANNKQHVFYFRLTAGLVDLHYWTNKTGSGVDTTIFTNSSETPYKLCGAFDGSGKLHIAYGLNTFFGKKVVYSSETSGWAQQLLMVSTAGTEAGFSPLELRINSSGDIAIPMRSKNDKVFKALLKQGSNPWQVSTLSSVDAGTDDWEDSSFNNNSWGTVFRDDGKLLIAYANGLSVRPRKLMYTMVSLTPPTVTGISPTAGPTAGGTAVTISGTGFDNGAAVTIGGVAATGVSWSSATSITANTPAGTAGAKNVVVTNPDTQTGTLTNGFTYIANTAPTLATNTGLIVNQTDGQTTIPNTKLRVTDSEQAATALTFTIGTAPTKGTLKKSGSALNASSTFTQDDIDNSRITYTPSGTAGADSFTFTVSDGAGGSIGSTIFSITITDNVAPTVTSVTVPGDATYIAGQNLDFVVNWSENIEVTGTNSSLGLTIGTTARTAAYLSKTATSITYRYTVQSGELDSNGIDVGALSLNTSTIEDSVGNDAVLTLNSVGSTTLVRVDAVSPTAAITYSAGPYKKGDSVTITADFSEAVADAPPAMKIAISAITGGSALSATDMTKVTSTQYTYSYTVGSGNGAADVTLSAGTDLAGNPITATPTSGGSFTIDKSASSSSLASSANPSNSGDSITFTATVTNSATGTVDFKDGGTSITGCAAVAINGSWQATCSVSDLTPGSHAITAAYSGDDTYNGSTSSTLTQVVRLTPAITTASIPAFTYGLAGSATIATTGYPAPALTRSGVLPLGVSFRDNGNGTATISGTPNASGSYTITVTATNSVSTAAKDFTLTVNTATDTLSALDTSISVSPDRHLFGVVELTTCGPTIPFTVRNSGTASVTLGTVTKGGTDAGQYFIASDTCTSQTIAKGNSCSVGVQFCPTTVGSKSAQLEIPHDGVTVTAFMYNHESIQEEAARRMPPVLYSLNIPNPMTTTGGPYTITWSLLGYDDDYLSRVAFFDCTGKPAGTCGDSFGTNFADSGNLAAVSTASGDWDYNGVTSKRFNYSYSFTPPAGAADIVIRFYRKTAADNAAGKGSLSLLVPGNVLQTGTSYYDADGRRLLHAIAP